MSAVCEVAVIGAGPYGLSIAAHLGARGIDFRAFGRPMWNWRMEMPEGMRLKSEGFASNLYEPEGAFTLEAYCAAHKLPYRAWGVPVPIETQCAYGVEFQKRFVPDLEDRVVTSLAETREGFFLHFEDGDGCFARRVVVATGIGAFQHLPEALRPLPRELARHSFGVHELRQFQGRDVTILGAGSSALDLAGILHERGISVRLVARKPKLQWAGEPLPEHRSLYQRIRYPMSGMAPGLRSRFYEDGPMLVRLLPRETRLGIFRSFLGPAGPWWMKGLVEREVPLMLGRTVKSAEPAGERLRLELDGPDGTHTVVTDHLIAATGFKIDVRRLAFLGGALRKRLRTTDGMPELSSHFEASVKGLYFVGLASAPTFGPLMRFMLGGGFAARRVSAHIAKEARKERTTSYSETPQVRAA
jgi:thioredoxin reductase